MPTAMCGPSIFLWITKYFMFTALLFPETRTLTCPEFLYLEARAPATARSTSALSNTIKGACPPSSMETLFTVPAACFSSIWGNIEISNSTRCKTKGPQSLQMEGTEKQTPAGSKSASSALCYTICFLLSQIQGIISFIKVFRDYTLLRK